jgi:hypothetical protein
MKGIDWAKPELAAKIVVNNHAKFDSFAWFDAPDDREKWGIFYTRTRDSSLLEESNHAIIEKELEPFTKGKYPMIHSQHHGHWAVGWVEGFAVKVYTNKGKLTKAFLKVCELYQRKDDYPVLDEEDYSERETEATWANVKDQTRYVSKEFEIDVSEEELSGDVQTWLSENKPEELENSDDQGGYPSNEAVREALIALGYKERE